MMNIVEGFPFLGSKLSQLKAFLGGIGLGYDDGISYSVVLRDEGGQIAATGSLDRNVIKCIGVAAQYEGQGVLAEVVTALITKAAMQGDAHLFLYTKPNNRAVFSSFGFHPIIVTDDILFMENKPGGILKYIQRIENESPKVSGRIGAIVANCNPFTVGHRYLVECAARECELVHLFVLSEDRSEFPEHVRYRLVEEGVRDLENVVIHRTDDYLISTATFPTYFIKDKQVANSANHKLDLDLFGTYIAKALNISVRYVGSEPLSPVTEAYNQSMKLILPCHGVQVREVGRLELEGAPVSASRVRALVCENKLGQLRGLVPESTFAFLNSEEGAALMRSRMNP